MKWNINIFGFMFLSFYFYFFFWMTRETPQLGYVLGKLYSNHIREINRTKNVVSLYVFVPFLCILFYFTLMASDNFKDGSHWKIRKNCFMWNNDLYGNLSCHLYIRYIVSESNTVTSLKVCQNIQISHLIYEIRIVNQMSRHFYKFMLK